MPTRHNPTPEERDERVKVDLDPDAFISGVLAVDPSDYEDEPEESEPES